ncbi:MAG: hypothetical protein A2289_20100 [Deltaproteobacteria bacterium RIFOXYA12_FULL_58_15]|nr:MAG: hypothetical protein A2289_20100 [Deltaproteobacteria bacterium RIFOXYA12_FULL_58_15]OGR07153.1 MAG: hypothetical protein A2341_03395 [Deltaproteobacteria bacterium RIFOXYB12_FULL_58_9]
MLHGGMARLYEFVIPVRKQTRQEFAKANPHLFLLMQRPEQEKGTWTFKTLTLSMKGAKIAKFAADEDIRLLPEIAEFDVFPVVKAADSPWPERISVGRARNNDIVLPDSSVSKLHAHFITENDRYCVVDANSHNGTTINEHKLESGKVTDVNVGDCITFGRSMVRLLLATDLYDLVAKHVEEKQ